ncbi:MAG: hypothetical protein CMK56_05470 [Proteobacteria bacterium]|nr:hypothetical protein [Pseudomonadota bacterium]
MNFFIFFYLALLANETTFASQTHKSCGGEIANVYQTLQNNVLIAEKNVPIWSVIYETMDRIEKSLKENRCQIIENLLTDVSELLDLNIKQSRSPPHLPPYTE